MNSTTYYHLYDHFPKAKTRASLLQGRDKASYLPICDPHPPLHDLTVNSPANKSKIKCYFPALTFQWFSITPKITSLLHHSLQGPPKSGLVLQHHLPPLSPSLAMPWPPQASFPIRPLLLCCSYHTGLSSGA